MNFKNLLLVFAFAFFLNACETQKKTMTNNLKLQSDLDTLSYSLGLSISSNFKNQGLDSIKSDFFKKAMDDVYGDEKTLMSKQEAEMWLNSYFKKMQEKSMEKQKESSRGIIEEGEKFLAENSKKEGVVSLPSGLQYKILKKGKGVSPGFTDKVKTHYHGTLLNGQVFDSSVDRGEPISFPVNGVIKGWTEALQLMSPGSKWKLFIPYDLAYGERGAGASIPSYATLIFEVELLEIEK